MRRPSKPVRALPATKRAPARKAAPAVAFDDPFRRPERISLAQTIADTVAEAIATGHLQPGERIVETALAERLGVSRVPTREALKVLAAQGILVGERHRGYRVAEFGPQTIAKVLEVRVMLETFLLRDAIAAWRAGQGSPSVLDEALRGMEAAARVGDARASLRADLEFHRAIRRAAQNEVAGALWDAIARHVVIIFSLESYRDGDLAAVARQHAALREVIVDQLRRPGSEEELRRAVEDHFLQVARAKARGGRRSVRLAG